MKITAFTFFTLAAVSLFAQAKDFRPKFDKSGVKGAITTQANPWFPFAKERIHALGGPNYAMKDYSKSSKVWMDGFRELEKLGVDVVY